MGKAAVIANEKFELCDRVAAPSAYPTAMSAINVSMSHAYFIAVSHRCLPVKIHGPSIRGSSPLLGYGANMVDGGKIFYRMLKGTFASFL